MDQTIVRDPDLDQAIETIARDTGSSTSQVEKAIELLDGGNTIPFIARYRKEVTRGLDEVALRAIEDGVARARELAARKATIRKSIAAQDQLTSELERAIAACTDLRALEDLYLPYKPKRRTRATVARERGLEPLAELLFAQRPLGRPTRQVLAEFVDAERDVPDAAAALQGACDIVAERWSENAETRAWLAKQARTGAITSQVKRGKKEAAKEKFELYLDHTEPLARVPSHRFLAMKRGEAEGLLRVGIQLDDAAMIRQLELRLLENPPFEFHDALRETVTDCYERLLLPATETATLQDLKERADKEAIGVFAKNMRELLLAAPAGPRITMGIDPGFRTGCKVAVVDRTGKFLENATIYPTPPRADTQGAARIVHQLIQKHGVELIAIGNGTASRETDAFVASVLREHGLDATKVMVNESGASIYSASEIAIAEYPDLDVTVRGAISIAHRLQDPLAALVKIDAKSIGVGQYQHDVNQGLLERALDREVESCVNSVGVDLNTASAPLLAHVAGIGPKLAAGIVQHRDANGPFTTRKALTKVPKLGKKAFEQAAGFLRIRAGKEPLDASAVHPESYHVVEAMAASLGTCTKALVGDGTLVARLDASQFVDDRVGLPTVRDILGELTRPGRDPRAEFRVAEFTEGVNEPEDLEPDMILEGVVTNVTHFGAFVDIGVHQDGLVHISELDKRFVEDPSSVVAVGDVVRVKVLHVDLDRRRIALSRKRV